MKNAHGLTPQQETFATAVAEGLSQAEAYRRAYPRAQKWSDAAVHVKASRLAASAKVGLRVDDLLAKAARANEMSIERLHSEILDISLADARELTELRRGCCRYCWGARFRYQSTAGELERDRQAFYRLPAKKRAALAGPDGEFDERGGPGFHKHRQPNVACPECFGDGVEEPFFKDTRNLSPRAARLFAGVKVTEKGMEIKARDQDAALDRMARMLGAYERDNRQKSDPLVSLLKELGGNVFAPVAGAELPEPGAGGDGEGDDDDD
jgi:phage terminase small subunit